MTEFFERAAKAAATLIAKDAPPAPARWKDGTLREGALPLDASGHELDMERARSGDFAYYKANRDQLMAQRNQDVIAAQRAAEEKAEMEYGTNRRAQIKASREKAAAEQQMRDEREAAQKQAAEERRWRIS